MHPIRVGLIAAFSVAALACLISVRGVSRVPDDDARRGLSGLLILSGFWAAAEVARLVVSSAPAKEVAYIAGLVVGLGTVGAWLYFCSAYTGHEYHRNAVFRQLAVGAFLAVVVVKVTNPSHGLYFTATTAAVPFPHLDVHLMPAHWIVTGLSYSLTAVGFSLLYELFSRSDLDTRALAVLVAVTGLPAVLDVLSYTGNLVLAFNYEPLGVAVFAVGVLFVVDEQFVALPAFWRDEIIETLDDVVLVFDFGGTLRDFNRAAAREFPALESARGASLVATLPDLADALGADGEVIGVDTARGEKFFIPEHRDLARDGDVYGRVLILSDVTLIERQRREVERQNRQFDDFSDAITHELRNTLAIADGYLQELAAETLEDSPEATEFYEQTDRAFDRMKRVISDLSKLAQYGQTVEEFERCDLRRAAETAWTDATDGEVGLALEGPRRVYADEARLVELLRCGFAFSVARGASRVTVSLADDELVIADDGESLSAERLERALEYGEAVPSAETGMLLPNLRTLARVHGWTVAGDPSHGEGVCLRIGDVQRTDRGAR